MTFHTLGERAGHGFRRVGLWIKFEVSLGSRPDDLGFDVHYTRKRWRR